MILNNLTSDQMDLEYAAPIAHRSRRGLQKQICAAAHYTNVQHRCAVGAAFSASVICSAE